MFFAPIDNLSGMKKIILLVNLLCFGNVLLGQTYFPETLTVDGHTYDYRYHHLETLFNQFPSQRIVKPGTGKHPVLQRNYIAAFTVADDSLVYLTDIQIKDKKDNWVSGNHLLHDRPDLTRPLYWISGLFEVGLGEADLSIDTLQPRYENYLVLEFRRGKLTRKHTFNALQMMVLKENQWKKFYNTNDYFSVYKSLQKNGMSDADIRNYIRNNILFYSKKFYLRF